MKHLIFLSAALVFLLSACSPSPPSSATAPPERALTRLKFADATRASGVRFEHVPTRTENKWLPEIMGGGVAIADFNRDGAPDIVLVNSGAVGAAARPENAKTRLFINDGKGVFTDQTDAWNLSSRGYGQGVAVGDFTGDGWTDLFLTSYEGDNRLLKNTGAKFEDVTENAGVKSDGKWATSAGFLDYDGDGDLDLYVAHYVNFTIDNPHKLYRNRMPIYSTPIYYDAVVDQLWRNEGDGKFTDASAASGITASDGNGLALAIGDIDKDGDTDIYVANDSDANTLWINEGGKFRNVAPLAGCAYSENGREEGSMGADFSDADGNDLLDIVVPNFQDEPTSLYSQIEPLLFREVSDAVGIGQSSRQRLKFGVDFFDADNDGDEDLIVANGHIEDNIDKNSETVTFAQLNSLYENLGDGKFTDVSAAAGAAFQDRQVSRGLATGDFDGDGDLDFVVANNGGTAQIGLNETAERGNFLVLWLEGERANPSAIGTRLVARVGDRRIERQVMGAQSYLSVSDLRVHFGLGKNEKIDELTVYWLGGEAQTLKDLAGGKFYYLKQGREPQPFIPGEKKID